MSTTQLLHDDLRYGVSLLYTLPETLHFADYRESILQFQLQVNEWLEQHRLLKMQEQRELFMKAAQSLRGSLSEFLSLPLRSDEEQIHKIITDHFQQFSTSNQALPSSAEIYRYLPHSTGDRRLQRYYTQEAQTLRKTIVPKSNGHTFLETWLTCNDLLTAIHFQRYLSQMLTTKPDTFFSRLPSPFVRMYFCFGQNLEAAHPHFMRIKLTIQTTTLSVATWELIQHEMQSHILSQFKGQLVQTTFLPARNEETFYLFDVSDKEELHNFRNTLEKTINAFIKKKLVRHSMLRLREMERIHETTV